MNQHSNMNAGLKETAERRSVRLARQVYLDNAATTQLTPAVLRVTGNALSETFGNPSSRHPLGLLAERKLRDARAIIADRVEALPRQVVFTSGGSEALGLAILGTTRRQRKPGHLLISALEHAAVRESANLAAMAGHEVESIPVGREGVVAVENVIGRLRRNTMLVALMHINNEVGTIQPVMEVGNAIKARLPTCRFVVDAVQSFGVVPVCPRQWRADLVAISGHKIHGPKGSGALVVAEGTALIPLWGGGNQEGGKRSGTENVPAIAGFGEAARAGRGPVDTLSTYCDRLVRAFLTALPGAYRIGTYESQSPHIAAIAIPGSRADTIVSALANVGVFVSSGSACASRSLKRSHVLEAMKIPRDHGVIRISPSRLIDKDDLLWTEDMISRTLPLH